MKTSCTFAISCLLVLSQAQISLSSTNCVLQKNLSGGGQSVSGNPVVCTPNTGDQDYSSSDKKGDSSSEEKDGDLMWLLGSPQEEDNEDDLLYDSQAEFPVDDGLVPSSDVLEEDYSDEFPRSIRAPEHRFMRFGRNHQFLRFGRGMKHSFMRFGRGDGHRFMRFGRPDTMHKFMRFGRGGSTVGGHRFMRFGRSGAAVDETESSSYEDSANPESSTEDERTPDADEYLQRVLRGMGHKFMRFGRATPSHSFMRFGRAVGHNFMRFGRIPEHRFMRFGRSGWSGKGPAEKALARPDDKAVVSMISHDISPSYANSKVKRDGKSFLPFANE